MSFGRNLANKCGRQLLDAASKIELDALKIVTKKVAHKAADTRGEFVGNKIANKIVKQTPVPDKNSKNVEEIIIPPEQREEILDEVRQLL